MEQDYTKNPLFLKNLPSGAVTHCEDCDEESFCNCENNEQITPYYSDDEARSDCPKKSETCRCKDRLRKKYQQAKTVCQQTVKRLTKDLKSSQGNPYIKETVTCRIDVYKSPADKKPIDSFKTQKSKAYTLRALALAGITAATLVCATDFLIRKALK